MFIFKILQIQLCSNVKCARSLISFSVTSGKVHVEYGHSVF